MATKFVYCNINSYTSKKPLVNYYLQKSDIKCALFVETKTKPDSSVSYQNWDILHTDH